MKIKTLGWLIIPAIAFPSCTEKALDYRSDEGTVTIAPEWSDFACPSSACYRFYTMVTLKFRDHTAVALSAKVTPWVMDGYGEGMVE